MATKFIVLFILLFTVNKTSTLPGHSNIQQIIRIMDCRTEIDSLTKKEIYTTTDILPENEGGLPALMRKLTKINIQKIPEDYDLNFLVAFIVDTDGSITGERIIKDKTNQVGRQMLDVVRSFKWTPAKCNNKNVRMLYKLPLIIDISVN